MTQTAPGWKTVRFAPVITSSLTDRAKVIIPTPHGLIRAQWQRVGNQIKAKLSLPIGIEATVNLPGIVNQKVTGKQSWQCSQ
ncbi:MAG: hypothetical protein JKX85_00075 [Phycisphaeraceae bacterium]|nr:hypothetical protein [Phycisphaeraceae bacterium]